MSEAASEEGQSRARSPGKSGFGGEPGGGGADDGVVHHPRSFKLRFAAQREPGRSYVSAVKPLGLPATVTGKFYSARSAETAADEAAERRALRRLQELFAVPGGGAGGAVGGAAPRTSAREVGRWLAAAPAERRDPRLHHHIRDSAWLKARLAVLAADDKLKQK